MTFIVLFMSQEKRPDRPGSGHDDSSMFQHIASAGDAQCAVHVLLDQEDGDASGVDFGQLLENRLDLRQLRARSPPAGLPPGAAALPRPPDLANRVQLGVQAPCGA